MLIINAPVAMWQEAPLQNKPVGIWQEGSLQVKGKRKRVLLTLDTKLRLIERLENGESFTKLAKEYNIGKTTIRDIFYKKQEYVNFAINSDSYATLNKRKTLKKSSYHELDMAVFKWFQEKRTKGELVTKSMLIVNAHRLHKELGMVEPFSASDGWVSGFKGRHGIESLEVPGENILDVRYKVSSIHINFSKLIRKD